MSRILWPVVAMATAMAVLIAGTLGDLPSWRGTLGGLPSSRWDPRFVSWPFEPRANSGGAATAAEPSNHAAAARNDPLPRQVEELTAKVAQDAREMAALRTTAEQMRSDLAALREQQSRDQALLAAGRVPVAPDAVAERANHAPPPVLDGPVNPASDAALRGEPASPPIAASAVPAPDEPPVHEAVTKPLPPPVSRRLIQARAALVSNQRPRARWLLRVAKGRLNNYSGRRDAVGNAPAPETRLSDAINLLDRGDSVGALREINQLLPTNKGPPDPARRDYRAPPASNRS